MAWKASSDWRLVVAANRDEAHDRPAAGLDHWPSSEVLAGRDLRSGGAWLGISSRHPRFAGLTNVADNGARDPDAPSRGGLVQKFLEEGSMPGADTKRFNPFNIILATDRRATLFTNHPNQNTWVLPPAVYCVSNGAATVEWETTGRLRRAVGEALEDGPATAGILMDRLMGSLDDRSRISSAKPGGKGSSRLFVQNRVYGTRCSTIIAVDGRGRGRIRERRFGPDGERKGETDHAFTWPT